jgi:SAM-dependent methyltransferase
MELPEDVYGPDAFSREDETDDATFYRTDRLVPHLDEEARRTVRAVIGQLVVEERPDVLDLMASWDSHLPESVRPASMTGLGLNENELRKNAALTDRRIHDLNADPVLPFPDASFDVVLNVVSVDYLTRPLEVFREVGRVLRPGGLFLVAFSNRMFPTKAVKVWREADERGRLIIVEDFFRYAGAFEAPRTFVSQGRPRPADDRHADEDPLSDPVFALYAERRGGRAGRASRPEPRVEWPAPWGEEEVERRRARTKETLACPHCGEALSAWEAPDGPFAEWERGLYHVCFNDRCPFLIRGFDTLARQGNLGYSCRVLYDRERDRFRPIPVNGIRALRSGIRESATTATT